ncbi:HNH endonuclease [Pseudooceanicola sp. C21-150M6]|uniref:HNH endonuclease n=1 Tax=Pseudooceanicola sp. C21-150M6 TaxID=3434355 RepID=UPI003D7FDC8F
MGRLKGRGLPNRLGKPTSRLRAAADTSGHVRRPAQGNWYKTARWSRLRTAILKRDGWTCQQTGVLLVGKYPAPNSPVIDHRKPHRWDPDLFWDEANLQAVSKEWHDGQKQSLEKRGLA